jgi:DNA-binding CsgD family transcriptional regulator
VLARPLQIASLVNDGSGRAALAPRQSAIVARVARGWSNKRIARDLDISPATVKTHLERLYRITGAANRAALAAWWRR